MAFKPTPSQQNAINVVTNGKVCHAIYYLVVVVLSVLHQKAKSWLKNILNVTI